MDEHILDLSIIIVSHNTRDYTLAAIRAVHETVKTHTYEVIIVENASTDHSAEGIAHDFPKDQIIQTESLVGFSRANNLGAQIAKGDHLLFLNPDTEVQPGAVDLLLDHFKSIPNCGAISGQLLNTNGSIQPQGGALPTLFNIAAWMLFVDDLPFVSTLFLPYQQRNLNYFNNLHTQCGWIGGTALLISKTLFEKIGRWDDAIFLYGEDVELCMRVHAMGKSVCLYPGAKIIHHRNKSTGNSQKAKIGELEGLIYIWKKHRPRHQLGIIRLLLWIGAWLRVILFGILGRNGDEKRIYLEAQKRVRMV